jgi:hypothetical protein
MSPKKTWKGSTDMSQYLKDLDLETRFLYLWSFKEVEKIKPKSIQKEIMERHNKQIALVHEKGCKDTEDKILEFLESLMKSDIYGEKYQFFKFPILDTKIMIVNKIKELSGEKI